MSNEDVKGKHSQKDLISRVFKDVHSMVLTTHREG
jgi:hypothetical protein